jgi:hypothetical protein
MYSLTFRLTFRLIFPLICLLILCPSSSYAQDQSTQEKPTPIWEVSFGTNQLFEGWFRDSTGVLPTTSALIINEWLITDRISLGLAFNLPMVPSRKVVDGKISESYSAPAVLIGPAVDLLRFSISKRAIFKTQFSLLIGSVIKDEMPIFPLGALRLKIETAEKSGVYIGVSASLAVDSIGLIYGVSHRF